MFQFVMVKLGRIMLLIGEYVASNRLVVPVFLSERVDNGEYVN